MKRFYSSAVCCVALLLFAYLLFAYLLFASCSNDSRKDEPVDPGNLLEYAQANPVKYEVQSAETYTIKDIYDHFGEISDAAKELLGKTPRQILNPILAVCTGAESPDTLRFMKVVLNYSGTDVNGKELVQSGVLCYNPTSTSISEQVIISRGTIGTKEESPSIDGFWPRGLMAVLPGELVLSADFIGFGITSNLPHPYLAADVTAKSQLDFTIAATLYLNSVGVKFVAPEDGFRTYSVGASQGGEAALAVHRAIEQNPTLEKCCGFKGSYSCDGPYDLQATYDFYKTCGKLEMTCAMPMVINGMTAAYPDLFEGYVLDDYLSENLKGKGVAEWINCKKYEVSELNDMIAEAAGGDEAADIVDPEVLAETSDAWIPLKIAIEYNNLADGSWTPRNKAVFHHSKNDPIVPYANLQSIVETFPSSTCIVSDKSLDLTNHFFECIWYYATFLSLSWRVDEAF